MSLFLLLFLFEVFLFAKTVQVWLLDTLHSTLLKLNRFILKTCFVCISFFSKNMCAENHCANNASCQRSSTDKLYQCLCPAGYEGARCQNGKQKKLSLSFKWDLQFEYLEAYKSHTNCMDMCHLLRLSWKTKTKKATKKRVKERHTKENKLTCRFL